MAAEKKSKKYGRSPESYNQVAQTIQRHIIRGLFEPATGTIRSLQSSKKGMPKISPLPKGFVDYAIHFHHVDISVTVGRTRMGDMYPV